MLRSRAALSDALTAEPIALIGTSDLAGLLRGKSVPLAELPGRMGRGVGIIPIALFTDLIDGVDDPGIAGQGGERRCCADQWDGRNDPNPVWLR
jgi:hypothetical protein